MRTLLLALAGCTASAAPVETRIVSVADLVWSDGPVAGLQTVDLWGNSKMSAHGSLTRLAAGLTEPAHTHSRPFRALVIAGTMRYVVAGRASKVLGPGSFIAIAAREVHFAQCLPDAACEVYVEQDGPLDIVLTAR